MECALGLDEVTDRRGGGLGRRRKCRKRRPAILDCRGESVFVKQFLQTHPYIISKPVHEYIDTRRLRVDSVKDRLGGKTRFESTLEDHRQLLKPRAVERTCGCLDSLRVLLLAHRCD